MPEGMTLDFARAFLKAVVDQDAAALTAFFAEDAAIFWHNTGERFTVGEYVRANCDYPGEWRGEVERVEQTETAAVIVSKVWTETAAFRVVSFAEVAGGKITRLDEYRGDVEAAPEWRRRAEIQGGSEC